MLRTLVDDIVYWLTYPSLIKKLFDQVIEAQYTDLFVWFKRDDGYEYQFLGYEGNKVIVGKPGVEVRTQEPIFFYCKLRKLARFSKEDYVTILRHIEQWRHSPRGERCIEAAKTYRELPDYTRFRIRNNVSGKAQEFTKGCSEFYQWCGLPRKHLVMGMKFGLDQNTYFMPSDMNILPPADSHVCARCATYVVRNECLDPQIFKE